MSRLRLSLPRLFPRSPVLAAFCLLTTVLAFIGWFSAQPPSLLLASPRSTPVLLDRHGTPIAFLADDDARLRFPAPLHKMGGHLPRLVVALEDHRFMRHRGIDFRATLGALVTNVKAGETVRGGSTITQQLVKLARSVPGKRGLVDKLAEAAAAAALERTWSKNEILERYLNEIDFANRRIGVRAAAHTYFHKEPEQLTLAEAVYLAGIPRAPHLYNPWSAAESCEERYRRNLERLVALGAVTGEEAERIASRPPSVYRDPPVRLAPHFVDHVMQTEPGLKTGGEYRTTLDLSLQRRVESILESERESLAQAGFRSAAIAVLQASTGDVLAMIGSPDYDAPGTGQINGATLFRSSGSTLKPFLYLKAIEGRDLTAASILPDVREALRDAYSDYAPENFDRRFLGPVRLREALGNSLNIPAVHTLSVLGARSVFQYLQLSGIRFERDFDAYGAGWIIGNAEVRLLDLCGAYTVFANDGVVRYPRVLPRHPVSTRRLASPGGTSILADILCDDDARLFTFGARTPLHVEGHRTAVKTGTSTAFRDRWCLGATRDHVVGVWIGNVDGSSPTYGAAGNTSTLWRRVVDCLVAEHDSRPLPDPALAPVSICPVTGLLPRSGTSTISEYFLPGTEPDQSASTRFDEEGTLLLPELYRVWCHSPHRRLPAIVDPAVDRFAILHPANGSRFSLDPRIPAAQQSILLSTNHDFDPAGIHWTIDGLPLQGSEWTLSAGTHTLTARLRDPERDKVVDSVTIHVGAGPERQHP